jgi:hypothetical protein
LVTEWRFITTMREPCFICGDVFDDNDLYASGDRALILCKSCKEALERYLDFSFYEKVRGETGEVRP